MDYECYRALFERSLSVLPPIERRVFNGTGDRSLSRITIIRLSLIYNRKL